MQSNRPDHYAILGLDRHCTEEQVRSAYRTFAKQLHPDVNHGSPSATAQIQALLKEVDNNELALALKTASPEMKQKVFANMSERAAQLIKEDMEYMGPVRVSDVESAQQRIVDIVRRLEDAGEIIIAGRGGESDIIV